MLYQFEVWDFSPIPVLLRLQFNDRYFMARRGTAGTSKTPETGKTMTQPSSGIGADRGNGRASNDNRAEQGGASMRESQEQMSFSSEEIAERAYQIYERDGRNDGHDMDHWLQAERELREERARKQGRGLNQQSASQPSAGTASRPQRPDEAPRSARRHQGAASQ